MPFLQDTYTTDNIFRDRQRLDDVYAQTHHQEETSRLVQRNMEILVDNQNLRLQVRELKQALEHTRCENMDLQKQVIGLQKKELTTQRQDVSALRQQANQIHHLEATLFEKDRECNWLHQTISDMDGHITQLESVRAERERHYNNLKVEKNNLDRSSKLLEETISEEKRKNFDLTYSIASLTKSLRDKETENQNLQESLADKEIETRELQRALMEIQAQNQKLEESLTEQMDMWNSETQKTKKDHEAKEKSAKTKIPEIQQRNESSRNFGTWSLLLGTKTTQRKTYHQSAGSRGRTFSHESSTVSKGSKDFKVPRTS